MKKWIVINTFFISVVCIVVFIFLNKLHYPSFPIKSITSKEVIQKMDMSNQKMVEISKDSDVIWYITKNSENVNETIERFISENGWEFLEREGNSLFFEKENETLVVSTQMWTKKYRLVKIPSHYKND